jgi:O-antigen ligase
MPMGKVLIAFTAWVAIGVPFSTWKGGSFVVFTGTLQTLLLVAFMAAFIQTIPDCLRVMSTVALAMATIAAMSLVLVTADRTARLGLGGGAVTLADANILCLYIIIGLPFLWLSASLKTGVKKVMWLSLSLPMLVSAGRTGSRMGLLTLGVGLILYFIYSSAKQRFYVIVGVALGLLLGVFFVPQGIRERFTTYFEAHSYQAEEAAESAEFRKMLLIRGLKMTADHPVMGVGPGEFMDADAAEAGAEGRRGMWHFTHNSYIEVSSETGVLGAVLFIIPLVGAYRGLSPIRSKNRDPRVRRIALFTQMVVLMTAFAAFFLSMAYGSIVMVVIAISGTLQVAVAKSAKLSRAS